MPVKTPAKVDDVVISFRPNLATAELQVFSRGLGLIGNNMDETARAALRARADKGLKTKPTPLTPQQQFEATRRLLDPAREGATDGIPASAFAQAIVNASFRFAGYKSTRIRGSFFILTDSADGLIPINAPEPEMREDLGRNRNSANSPAILLYRAWYREWQCRLRFEFNANVITLDELVPLVELAGFHIGVGGRRPEMEDGSNFGRFTVQPL